MCRFPSLRRRPARTFRIECLESRKLLAADFVLDALEYATAPAITAVAPQLQEVHDQTGVSKVRDRYGLTGAGQTVVVIDSGIAYDHMALGAGLGSGHRVVGGWDFTEENDADPYDDGPGGFHGTHVAGIIGSSDDVHTGVAPGVDLIALRVFNDQGEGYFDWVEAALQWVHDNRDEFANPITTVNLSLGAEWNSNAIPSWATLEDEFAQLQQDNIFVTVAAGNSFEEHAEIGLSYPAASPYVVPVSSVGDDGELSDFSQRHPRVIAAPGEQIVSTAPDYLFDFNGVADDFAAASGTSMAAPYLAGASVLVREAMNLAGIESITPVAIYSTLRDSSETLFDPATDTEYARLNVSAAIDSILDVDDVSEVYMESENLGMVDSLELTHEAGLDAWYQFSTKNDGLLTIQSDAVADIQLYSESGLRLAAGLREGDRTRIDWDAASGDNYSVRVSAAESAPTQLSFVNLVRDEGGRVTIQGSDGADEVLVSLGLETIWAVVNGTRYRASAGTREVRVEGAGGADSLRLNSTADHDHLTLRQDGAELFGRYRVIAEDVEQIRVNGGGGNDVATFLDSGGNDSFYARPTYSWMRFEEGLAYAAEFTTVVAHASDGVDRAVLFDSAGDDVLTIDQAGATMVWLRGTVTVNRFEQVLGVAKSGGVDTAEIGDTPGDDTFYGKPTHSWIRGEAYLAYAAGFQSVTATASAGWDRAELSDSPGDDVYRAEPTSSELRGDDFQNRANNFDVVVAYSSAGGVDQATLIGSDQNDQLYLHRSAARLVTGTVINYAARFESLNVASSAGRDRVFLNYDETAEEFDLPAQGLSTYQGRGVVLSSTPAVANVSTATRFTAESEDHPDRTDVSSGSEARSATGLVGAVATIDILFSTLASQGQA